VRILHTWDWWLLLLPNPENFNFCRNKGAPCSIHGFYCSLSISPQTMSCVDVISGDVLLQIVGGLVFVTQTCEKQEHSHETFP